MATEMPIEQEYGRFVQGITDLPDGGALVEMGEEEEPEVEEHEDGSATVTLPGSERVGPTEETDFYDNLAEVFNQGELQKIALRYMDLIKDDKEARKRRDKQYEEGIRRTGLGDDAPGGASFAGASKVVHPVMAEACVDFAAATTKELFPPDGPVRTRILGDQTDEKVERAERKRDYLNWQLTEQIEEFQDEQEQLFTQLPLGGSQYMKFWWDDNKKRPCAEFVPIDNILLPFAAANFYTAQRVTEIDDITEFEFKQRVNRGLYKESRYSIFASMEPEESAAEKANNKIEGREWVGNEDGLRRMYHIYTWLEVEEDGHSTGKLAPYILMIDSVDMEVLGLYRNWEQGDETLTKLDWIVEYKFIPWRGAYAIGLPHLIGGLAAALTGALRALLDTAHVNNSLTALKLKGAKISGQSQQIEITQVTEIEAGPGVDDIRKVAMPMPFNPPSEVLFKLLGWLDGAAKGVVSTAEEKIKDLNSNAPVGTTQALIEQGAKVFSSIHARVHKSQKRALQIVSRINRWYLNEQRRGDLVAELPISPDDFRQNTDVIPVSDPHIFSETQRMAQNQAVLQLATQYPQSFDVNAVLQRIMKQIKVPNIDELMPQSSKPAEMDAADENASMALGRRAFAYPRQDHLSHIQAHLDFALDPMLGSSKLMGPTFLPQVLEHLKQHITLWYTQQMKTYVTAGTDLQLGKYAENKNVDKVDQAMAAAASHVKMDTQQVFAGVMQAMEQIGQIMQQFPKPQPPMDGDALAILQASMAETQRRQARDQADIQLKAKDQEIRVAMNAENNLTKERMKTADLTVEEVKLKREQQDTAIALQDAAQANLLGGNYGRH